MFIWVNRHDTSLSARRGRIDPKISILLKMPAPSEDRFKRQLDRDKGISFRFIFSPLYPHICIPSTRRAVWKHSIVSNTFKPSLCFSTAVMVSWKKKNVQREPRGGGGGGGGGGKCLISTQTPPDSSLAESFHGNTQAYNSEINILVKLIK